jgi:hypothetical protein
MGGLGAGEVGLEQLLLVGLDSEAPEGIGLAGGHRAGYLVWQSVVTLEVGNYILDVPLA